MSELTGEAAMEFVLRSHDNTAYGTNAEYESMDAAVCTLQKELLALRRVRDAAAAALERIAAMRPSRKPDAHEDSGGNYNDAESNGYDRAAWEASEIAEQARTCSHDSQSRYVGFGDKGDWLICDACRVVVGRPNDPTRAAPLLAGQEGERG